MASVYWAWTWPSGDRRAYKQFFDSTCFASVYPALQLGDEVKAICPSCREEVTDGPEVLVYATYYVPGQERQDTCLVYHVPCFEQAVGGLTQHAQRLPDRELGKGAPSPSSGEASPWAWVIAAQNRI